MEQNTKAEEAKPEADKKPYPKPASLSDVPLWLITSFVLLLTSSVPPIYFFLKDLKSKLRLENFSGTQLFESRQARGKWD